MTGVALAICVVTALMDGAVAGAVSDASVEIWLRYMGAAALMQAAVTVPTVWLAWLAYRFVRKGSEDDGDRVVLGVAVLAAMVPFGLHALRFVQARLLEDVAVLSGVGLLTTLAAGLAILAVAAGAFALGRSIGLSALLASHVRALAALGWGAIALALAAVSIDPSAWARSDVESARPNVVLISIDSLRDDIFSEYMASGDASPALQRFVDGGRRYRWTYTTYAASLASHASMFSGLYSPEHGAVSDAQPTKGIAGSGIDAGVELLAERLGAAGYETIGVHSNRFLGPPYGLEAGFQTYIAYGEALRLGRFDWSLAGSVSIVGYYKHWFETNVYHDVHPNTRLMLELLANRDASRPFFAFLHYIDLHVPHRPSKKFREPFDGGPLGDVNGPELERRIEAGEFSEQEMPAVIARLRDLNHAMLAEVDRFLAPVLDWLEEEGRLEDTLVILCADHGDNLYEKDHTYTHTHVYEASTRVPLILRAPGVRPSESAALTSIVDFAPTIYGFTGVAPPDGLAGIDLLRDPPRSVENGGWIFLEDGVNTERGWSRAIVLPEGIKYLRTESGSEELYDLNVDPRELEDLAERRPGLLARTRERFDAIYGAMKHAEIKHIPIDSLPGDTQESLRALGYIE